MRSSLLMLSSSCNPPLVREITLTFKVSVLLCLSLRPPPPTRISFLGTAETPEQHQAPIGNNPIEVSDSPPFFGRKDSVSIGHLPHRGDGHPTASKDFFSHVDFERWNRETTLSRPLDLVLKLVRGRSALLQSRTAFSTAPYTSCFNGRDRAGFFAAFHSILKIYPFFNKASFLSKNFFVLLLVQIGERVIPRVLNQRLQRRLILLEAGATCCSGLVGPRDSRALERRLAPYDIFTSHSCRAALCS